MILKQDKDSIYIAADTFYSARLIDRPKIPEKLETMDSLHRVATDSINARDTLSTSSPDSTHPMVVKVRGDSLIKTLPDNTIRPSAPIQVARQPEPDRDHEKYTDTTKAPITDSTLRYILAYHHVRIFSDSLQAVSDSLYYSGQDSIFRLFYNPIAWGSGNYQITGDTMYVYTKNKKANRLYVFENGLAINKVARDFYNQIKGTTINAYFKDGQVDYMRAKGNAESIYYVQDDNKAYTGVNKAHADIIDMIFAAKSDTGGRELRKVVLRNDAEGSMIPFKKVNFDDMRLRGFKWQEARRPKSKEDLFE